IEYVDLDPAGARAVGELCGLTGASDVVDTHVALEALRHRLSVVTSDPTDFGIFGPELEVIVV
ncbi:MAG: hypothetical protein ACLGH4_07595, partial [Actinomycetes bacterium]